ncbi:glycine-rich domain-containing protein [Streptomyces sp. NPDC056987]|uniref:glycine-rich domain-containing protein n=1 Tax=Streptomyces sp. NPDC056987 TaxID=3345988 RepID=UPI00364529A8
MSTTTAATRTRDARSLLTAEEFAGVAATVKRANPGMETTLAERITVEALAFVATAANRSSGRLAPSPVVDEGWHALILHTRVYADLCTRLGGRFVHHIPQPPNPTHPHVPGILAFTQAAITGAGFQVDEELWQPGPKASAECQHVPNCGDTECEANCESGPN